MHLFHVELVQLIDHLDISSELSVTKDTLDSTCNISTGSFVVSHGSSLLIQTKKTDSDRKKIER